MSPLPPRVSRLLVAAIVLECVVLAGIQVRRWMAGDHKTVNASTTPEWHPGPAEPSPDPSTGPAPAQAPPRIPDRTVSGPPSGPDRADRLQPPSPGSVRRGESNPPAPVTGEPQTAPQPHLAGSASRSAGMDAAGRPGSGPNHAVPGQNPHQPAENGGATPNGSPTSVPGQPGVVPQGAVSPTVTVPGMPVAEGDPDSENPGKDEDDGSDKPDDDEETPGEDDSGSDNVPPVLDSLRFDPAQVEGGNVTTLTVQAHDEKSGLKSIWGEIRSPNRSASLSFGSGAVVPGTVFTFPISLPREAQTGTWYVAWISLTDGSGNSKLIQAPTASEAPPGGTFAAFSSESDATPPEILQVSFDRAAVGPGEKNIIVVEARDDRSGIASVMGACQSPSKSALVWFNGAANADSGAWAGEVLIPRTADCGEWGVQQLAVKDKAGNTTLIQADSPLLARAGFRVAGGSDCDFTSPTLEQFMLNPAIVLSGTATEILVTAKVYDAGSGAVTMTGWFEGPAPAGEPTP